MLYRTTSQTSSRLAIEHFTSHNAAIIDLQKNISSGVRLHRASDDPASFQQVTSLSVELKRIQSETRSIGDTEGQLNATVSTLQRVNDLIVKAESLAQQGIQANSQSERNALAVEVDGILDSLQDIAVTNFAGNFLFGGTASESPPYRFNAPSVEGGTLDVEYLGAPETSVAYIGSRISIETLQPGDQVFGNSSRSEMLVLGNTGASTSSGTASVIGRADLLVEHLQTTFFGTSGIAPGASSIGNDTALGPANAHQVTIVDLSGSGDFGTAQLNNGDEIAWSRTDSDLPLLDENGRMIHADMSNIASGFAGTVGLQSDGTMSIDGGVSTVTIDFSESQTFSASSGGGQVHIDSSEIRQTGTDHLEFPGSSNLFQVIHDLSNDLRGNRNLDGVGYAESLDRRIGELEATSDNVLDSIGRNSASLQSIAELRIRLSNLELETETRVSELQSTDIPSAVLQLQQHQTLLEFTYSVTARVAGTNLLDFLR